jgi:hypothetical protein
MSREIRANRGFMLRPVGNGITWCAASLGDGRDLHSPAR